MTAIVRPGGHVVGTDSAVDGPAGIDGGDRQPGGKVSRCFYTWGMSVTVELSAEVLARLEAEAARRGVPMESLISETLERDFPARGSKGTKPKLGFVGMGTSRTGRTAREADDMLAEGFGRD